MANGISETGPGSAVYSDSARVRKAHLAGVELTPEQEDRIRSSVGVRVRWLLFEFASPSYRPDADLSSHLSLTWCW